MYTYKIWDKKTPINGVEAKEVLKIHKITTSEVGLVLDENNRVIVLQYDNINPLTKLALTNQLKKITEELNNPPVEESSNTEELEQTE